MDPGTVDRARHGDKDAFTVAADGQSGTRAALAADTWRTTMRTIIPASADRFPRSDETGNAARWAGPALLGAGLDLLLAALLAILLTFATNSPADAVPRPLVLGVLLATPGMVGILGVIGRRPGLLFGAGVALLPAAVLSFTGLTLVFLFPAGLLLIGGLRLAASADNARPKIVGEAALVAGLIVAAGWTVLFGFARPACAPIPGGEHCSSAAISAEGVAIGAGLLLGALAVAAWPAWRARLGAGSGDVGRSAAG